MRSPSKCLVCTVRASMLVCDEWYAGWSQLDAQRKVLWAGHTCQASKTSVRVPMLRAIVMTTLRLHAAFPAGHSWETPAKASSSTLGTDTHGVSADVRGRRLITLKATWRSSLINKHSIKGSSSMQKAECSSPLAKRAASDI